MTHRKGGRNFGSKECYPVESIPPGHVHGERVLARWFKCLRTSIDPIESWKFLVTTLNYYTLQTTSLRDMARPSKSLEPYRSDILARHNNGQTFDMIRDWLATAHDVDVCRELIMRHVHKWEPSLKKRKPVDRSEETLLAIYEAYMAGAKDKDIQHILKEDLGVDMGLRGLQELRKKYGMNRRAGDWSPYQDEDQSNDLAPDVVDSTAPPSTELLAGFQEPSISV